MAGIRQVLQAGGLLDIPHWTHGEVDLTCRSILKVCIFLFLIRILHRSQRNLERWLHLLIYLCSNAYYSSITLLSSRLLNTIKKHHPSYSDTTLHHDWYINMLHAFQKKWGYNALHYIQRFADLFLTFSFPFIVTFDWEANTFSNNTPPYSSSKHVGDEWTYSWLLHSHFPKHSPHK